MISGNKSLATINTTASPALTVNFTTTTGGCALVHVIVFGTTASGLVKYSAWIFLGTGNSAIEDSSTSVTAGITPTIQPTFTITSSSARLNLKTLMSGTISNPYIFYEVYGNSISSIV